MTDPWSIGLGPDNVKAPAGEPGALAPDWLTCRLLNMGAYRDRDGRPLAEGKVPAGQRQPGVVFEQRRCPYPGARATVQPERPMNVSAMRRVAATLPESFGAFLHLRDRYLSGIERQPSSYADLWRLGMLGAALPLFLACRDGDPVADGDLPPYIADLQKFTAGINNLMLELALREAVWGAVAVPPMTVEALLSEADRMLVGESEVCAAPATLIAEGLNAYLAGHATFSTVLPPIDDLLKDCSSFLDFAAAFADLKTFRWLLRCMVWCAARDVTTAVNGGDSQGSTAPSAGPQNQGPSPSSPGIARSPALGSLSRTISAAAPAERIKLLARLAEGLVAQGGARRARLLEAFGRAARVLVDDPGVDIDAIRRRFPALNRLAAAQPANAVARYLALAATALPVLEELEGTLRLPLGLPPAGRTPPADLLDTLLEADLGSILRGAVDDPPSSP